MYFNFWVGVCRRGGGLMGLLEVRCSLSSRKMMLDGDIVCREGGWGDASCCRAANHNA